MQYYVPWEHMLPGHSVFIKTTATAKQVQSALRAVEKHFNIVLKAHARCEFDRYGVRVWRMA